MAVRSAAVVMLTAMYQLSPATVSAEVMSAVMRNWYMKEREVNCTFTPKTSSVRISTISAVVLSSCLCLRQKISQGTSSFCNRRAASCAGQSTVHEPWVTYIMQ